MRVSTAVVLVLLLAAGPAAAQSGSIFDGPLSRSYPGQAGYAPHYAPDWCDRYTGFCYRGN